MAESTLALTYQDIAQEVGSFLGFGRGADAGDKAWTPKQQSRIESCIKAGYHNFLYPDPQMGEGSPHQWSFLSPVATLAIAQGDQAIDLPADFGNIVGNVTLVSDNTSYTPIPQTGEGIIRAQYSAAPETTGQPRMCAVRPIKGTDYNRGQRFELAIFPAADAAYTIEMAYTIIASALTEPRPYALGGAVHAQTILESCLAVAEARMDDALTVHQVAFAKRMAASIGFDRKLKPQFFGRNVDRSDDYRNIDYPGRRLSQYTVTYASQEW